MQKLLEFCLFSLVGQWALFTRFGVMWDGGWVWKPTLWWTWLSTKEVDACSAPATSVGHCSFQMPRPDFWKFGNLGTWKSRKLGSRKIEKIKILEIRIRSAQNVGKVWISRKKNLLAPFGAIPCHFLHGPNKSKKSTKFAYFPWWANGPYSPGLGSCAGVILAKCQLLCERGLNTSARETLAVDSKVLDTLSQNCLK